MTRRILTPCPPKKRCRICEARLNEQFGSNPDHTAKYKHQAEDAARMAIGALTVGKLDLAIELFVRSASYANLVLGPAV